MCCDTREIELLGELGERFGRIHRLNVASPAEAIRALCALHPTFRTYMENSHNSGVAYKFLIGDEYLLAEEVYQDIQLSRDLSCKFTLAPVLTGSKSSFGQILLGAVIIIASVLTYNAYGAAWGSAMMAGYNAVVGIGVSMVLGGVTRLLSPTVGAESAEAADNKPSYIFNGATNTISQGQPVPILYGEMTVGSAVVSAGISANDIAI